MFLEYFETITLAVILCSVFFGGIVKGSVGIGMSMFSVPLIAFILPPTKAMMLLCFPVIVTNFIQMDIKRGISNYRFFPMFMTLFLGIIIGGKLILSLNLKTISIIIALTIIIFTLFNFLGLNLYWLKPKYEKIISIFIGFFSGILGGLSTFYAPPIITFLVSLNLAKENFIRTTATMYFLASIPLYSSLIFHGLGNFYDLLVSLIITSPALLGQYFGTKIRKRLPNAIFRKTILVILITIGFSLLIKNL
ncbi:sulfite exporter TauE/SafE family protein [Alphaproteobacteria bacterium]|nr:sulfite exporter TauE/SafE family protein [Alphaproteobacteria bacterium]